MCAKDLSLFLGVAMLSAGHLRDRVFRSQSAACSASLISQSYSRPAKYKPWDDDCMQKALQAVKLDGASVRRAAMEYGVPKSTLGDRVSGRVTHGVVSGPPKYLNDEEEEELVRFILGCASVGYPKTRKEILSLVQTQVDKPISHEWWDSLCKRHPNLTFRTPAPLSIARATAVDETALERYFDLLERTLGDNGLLEKPCQVFNMDETGMPLSPQSPKCVFGRGEKNPVNIDGGDKAQITVVACVSASGYCIPPMVIWDRKKLSLELTAGEVPGTFYGLSDKGWMDQELFDAWLSCHFLRYAPPTRPLLLLLDGHSSHYSPYAIRFAAKEKVIMFALPPHTTHVTQPLDRSCFSPLKVAWREVCQAFMAENPGKRVTRFNFLHLFSLAWMKSMTMKNIVSGFRVTGVYPVNRKVVEKPKEFSKPSLPEATGLAYIPLYSPAKVSSVEPRRHTEFSAEELDRFECRYENGYDLNTDERYNNWLRMYHPDECLDQSSDQGSGSDDQVVVSERQQNDWQKLLSVPDPLPAKTLKPKQTARVLTRPEFLQQMREKEQRKKEAALKKEERKLAREIKAKNRAAVLERKAYEQEEKKKKSSAQKATRQASRVREPTRPVGKVTELTRPVGKVTKPTRQVSKVTESGRQVSRIGEESDSSEVQEETDSSFVAESFICPLLDLAPPFENSCTLPSPEYTFNSIEQSPTPSKILRFTSDVQNRTSVTPNAEDVDKIDNGAKDGEAESLRKK